MDKSRSWRRRRRRCETLPDALAVVLTQSRRCGVQVTTFGGQKRRPFIAAETSSPALGIPGAAGLRSPSEAPVATSILRRAASISQHSLTHTHTKKNYVFDKARRVDSDNANALGPHSGRETPLTYAASNLLPSARMSTKMEHPSRTRDETNQNDTKRSKCLRVRPHEATVYTLDSVHRFAKRGDDQHAGRRKHILQRVFRFVRSLRTPRRFARCTVTSVGAGQKMLFLVRSSNAFSALITYARKFPGA